MTTDELSQLSQLLDAKLQPIEKRLTTVEQNMATKEGVKDQIRWGKDDLREEIKDAIEESFLKYRNEIVTKLDGIAGSLQKHDEEHTIHQGQHDEITERLDTLDGLHPHGQHPH